ncbi:MAG: hypothetical protein GX025_01005 [Clostridiales bacterium]|nr:hypothetical protein [Clostridiales bacterium]
MVPQEICLVPVLGQGFFVLKGEKQDENKNKRAMAGLKKTCVKSPYPYKKWRKRELPTGYRLKGE